MSTTTRTIEHLGNTFTVTVDDRLATPRGPGATISYHGEVHPDDFPHAAIDAAVCEMTGERVGFFASDGQVDVGGRTVETWRFVRL